MLSVAIIAKNESLHIASCIASVRALSGDIVVVIDSSSTDETQALSKSLGCRVFLRPFDTFASQKNFATSQTKYSWVLSLDADETISPELAREITKTLSAPKYQVYSLPRINFIFGKQIRHTNWSPEEDRHVWLFNKNFAKWQGIVHEQVVTRERVGKLTFPKIHQNYSTVEDYISQLNHYTSFESAHLSPGHFPFWKFFRHYVLKLGFLDGWHGLFLSYLQAISGLTVIIKSWLKNTSS